MTTHDAEPTIERLCQVCHRHPVTVDGHGTDHTCATCLHRTRTNLDEITRLAAHALGIAILDGINSNAAVIAGPTANPETWGYRRMTALHGLGDRIDTNWLRDQIDIPHPSWILGTWNHAVREHLTQLADPGHQPTLTEAHDYLDHHLTWLAHDPTFGFDELAQDLATCRTYLENVLHDGQAVDRGAPCPTCGRTLTRSYGDTEDDDRWTCSNGHWWTDHDYRAKVAAIYVGVADRLTIRDLAGRLRIPERTLREWTRPTRMSVGGGIVAVEPKLKPAGRDSSGRNLYPVAVAQQLRDDRKESA